MLLRSNFASGFKSGLYGIIFRFIVLRCLLLPTPYPSKEGILLTSCFTKEGDFLSGIFIVHSLFFEVRSFIFGVYNVIFGVRKPIFRANIPIVSIY
jgi:hypothetical protein